MPVTIIVRTEGPFRITEPGDVILVDQDGNQIAMPTNKPTVSLCRCGASSTKPFCDGTHSRLGFRAAEAAREEYDARMRAEQEARDGTLPPGALPPPG